MKRFLIFLSLIFLSSPLFSAEHSAWKEDDVTAKIAAARHLDMQATLLDGTRCDLVSSTYAIEIERATKQYEAWGQATWYAAATSRKPAVILLTDDWRQDSEHLKRAKVIAYQLSIDYEVLDPRTLKPPKNLPKDLAPPVTPSPPHPLTPSQGKRGCNAGRCPIEHANAP